MAMLKIRKCLCQKQFYALESNQLFTLKTSKIDKEAWNAFSKAFDDSGLLRRVGLITNIIKTRLEDGIHLWRAYANVK